MFYRTEAAIDLDAVDYNFENTRKKVPQGVKLLCVIKAFGKQVRFLRS